jgi:HTH-type transcriptional regulator/antitoxin HigA
MANTTIKKNGKKNAAATDRLPLDPREKTSKMRSKTKINHVGDTYFALVKKFPLVPIVDDKHLQQASAFIDTLLTRELDEGEAAYLDVISDLVCRYEDEHHPLPTVSQAAMLRYLLEEKGVSQAHVAREAGISASVISEALSGARELSKTSIRGLAKFFGVSPSLFLVRDQN